MSRPKVVIGVTVLLALATGAFGWWLGARRGGGGDDVKDFHIESMEKVPEHARILASFDIGFILDRIIEDNAGLIEAQDGDKARKALVDASEEFLGVNLFAAERAIVWAAPQKRAFAMYLQGDFKDDLETDGRSKKHNGTEIFRIDRDVWAVSVLDGLVIGNKRGVEMAVDLAEGDVDSLADHDTADVHKDALDRVDDGPMIFSVAAEGMLDRAPEGIRDVEGAAMSLAAGGDFAAVITGDSEAIDELMDAYEESNEKMDDLFDELLDKVKDEKIGEAVVALTLGKYKIEDLKSLVEIEKEDDAIVVSGGAGGWVVGYLGVMAVVAVPAFIKYMRRAKTTEAIDRLDMIYKSASNYYTAPRVERGTGRKIACQFPASQKMTPDVSDERCCPGGPLDRDGDSRCDVNIDAWSTPTWAALNFQMNDQHYFGYAFTSSGEGAYAKFTATAHADLDCDGVLSTFERYGYGDPSSTHAECSMRGSSAFYKNNETE